MQNFFDNLQKCHPEIDFVANLDLKKYTTIGIGGLARIAAFPKNYKQVRQIIQYCLRHFVPYCILGKGANVLVADNGFLGVVIFTSNLQGLQLKGQKLYVGAGVTLANLTTFANRQSLAGYVPLMGFPATVGGAIYMNAGVQSGHIGDLVDKVYTIDRRGNLQIFDKNSCQFAYKSTVFMQNKSTIIGAILRAVKTDTAKIQRQIAERQAARANLPKGRSMGCVFKNFEDVAAGILLDGAGCKGLTVGGAMVSLEHANFIINVGGAMASDVKVLIEHMKDKVYKIYKRQLKEEIEYIGEF